MERLRISCLEFLQKLPVTLTMYFYPVLYKDVLLILIKNYAWYELDNLRVIHDRSIYRNTNRKSALGAKLFL